MQGKNFILFVAHNFTLRRTPKGICNEERAEKETFFPVPGTIPGLLDL